MAYNTVLVSGTQHSDSVLLYHFKMITMVSLTVMCHHTKIIITDCIPYPISFIPVTHLLCSGKFVPLNLPNLFLSPPHPLAANCLLSASYCVRAKQLQLCPTLQPYGP